METNQQNTNQQSTVDRLTKENATESNAIQIPEISLPKGGGALKGIDEKFEINAANGTAGFSIPLPVSPGRNGFSPALSLSYNSGGGNSPFGLGWSVGYPMIQRKTDKRLPRYRNDEEDIFMFSGAEDLVPFLVREGEEWKVKEYEGDDGYKIKRYRPRLEGGFSRIEKICHPSHGVYWKVTTRDNVATLFGRSEATRIADPSDATRIFQWMPEFSYDDKGNWIWYQYKKEDLVNVPNSLFERSRKKGIADFTNCYLKRIKYGNRKAYYADSSLPYDPQMPADTEHFFELVMDYGEHDTLHPKPQENGQWDYRLDAFSSYRSGFEIRTNRCCKRILMFHHFQEEKQFVGTPEEEIFGEDYLVRSLDLGYEPSSINNSGQSETTYLTSITQCGYIRKPNGIYSKKSLPPMEFEYEQLNWNKEVKTVDSESIINAPVGLTNNYQWVDLYGEGVSGILTEQGEGWFYKSNLGDIEEDGNVAFAPAKKVIPKPSFRGLSSGALSIQDLAGNGEKQVVVNAAGVQGYFELTDQENWKAFKAFDNITNVDLQDPNARFIDLNGDGQPDIVVTEENVFTWYAADGKRGHLKAERTVKPFDEDYGPAIVFADREQTIFTADMSGDGLADIVRIRNGEICYWANMGYGRFSAKVNMGNAPVFDHPSLFNPKYLHIADVSGTGAADILYLGNNSFKAYINLSGNAWSDAHMIEPFFPNDTNSRLSVIDLLGTGTSCLVWSSDLPYHTNAPMRYMDLMSSKKPHVMIHYKNNLGKETSVQYKSSTHYYLKDKLSGTPWITKLPFPVQVVSKSVVVDRVTDVRFATEYRYHHGYYDHPEREFRGFGMVEQIDTENYDTYKELTASQKQTTDKTVFQAPMLTKTWFHTGTFLDREKILTYFKDEYWHALYNRQFPHAKLAVTEPELCDAIITDEIKALDADKYREALRSCKGMMLRQEVFALDAPECPSEEALQLQMKPYTVATHNCFIQQLQARDKNLYGVFQVTESEAITIHYERDETDYRIAHSLNTKIDDLGNVLENAAVVYGRKQAKADADFQAMTANVTDFSEEVLKGDDAQQNQLKEAFRKNITAAKAEQTKTHIIYTQNAFAQYDDGTIIQNDIDLPHAYRLRPAYETKTFELSGFTAKEDLFQLKDLENALTTATEIGYHEVAYENSPQSRRIEHIKSRYLSNELTPLAFGFFDQIGLSFENYQLAFTPELVADIYQKQDGTPLQADGEIVNNFIETKGRYSNIDGNLWIRSGITHFKEDPVECVANTQQRFYVPLAFENPFGAVTTVQYDVETFSAGNRNNDGYYLYLRSSQDAVENKAQVAVFNYRTLSPSRLIDINANPSTVILNELGLVKAMALEGNGIFTDADRTEVTISQAADSLKGITEYTDQEEADKIRQLFGSATYNSTNTSQLRQLGNNLLQKASIRFVYNFHQYQETGELPTVVGSIAREEHFADNSNSKLQFSFEYSDGMGNVAMTKVQAEPGKAYYMEDGERKEKDTGTDLRWIGNGRTVLNNKGNPVKQYEPYFSTNFLYEDAPGLVEIGVTPILFYDALGRLTKTLFPDGTLSRVVFDSWKQISFDQNDTVEEEECLWYQQRTDPTRPDFIDDPKEHRAAVAASKHANTPSILHLDSLGRPVLNMANNGRDVHGKDRLYTTYIQLDIEGNAKSVSDAKGNTVMAYKYSMLGHRIYQNSMDAGERWAVSNIMGSPIHRWDSREQVFSFIYDLLQRPKSIRVTGGDGDASPDIIYEYIAYGEEVTDAYQHNLRGQAVEQYDTAGRIKSLSFDFKGNLLSTTREFNVDYKQVPNWEETNRANPAFDPDLKVYTSEMQYDGLNRSIKTTTPDDSITQPTFNEAGLLEQVRVTQTDIAEKVFVKNIDYDAKGQRERIVYGDKRNNTLATTTYEYDEATFRLIHLLTTKADGSLLQDLYYTYDPVGNITEIEDKAIPTRFFNNFKIEPKGLYQYDALNRLIAAEGKEHAGQAIDFGQCDNWQDKNFLKSYSPGDDMAWQKYQQQYQYDPVGNILKTKHKANGGNWTRTYQYEAETNRLKETKVGGQTYRYPHHAQHGFIESLPHLQRMDWNFKDELQAVAKQKTCTGVDPETTYYVYDSSGQRVRKVTERHGGGGKKQERVYLGGVEVYKKYTGNDSSLERTTLHIMDDTRRIAMVDTRNEINDDTDKRTVRFQFSNHLGSASLEINDEGSVISYEEHHPYGTTAYQAVNKDIKAVSKHYRYTGMERDEESGLEYHSARYYLSWLGKWLSSDVLAEKYITESSYTYAGNNPKIMVDLDGKEKIVIAGSESRSFKLTFALPALKKVKDRIADDPSEQTTLLMFTAGYTEKQKKRIQKYAEGKGASVEWLNSADEVVSYLNYKQIEPLEEGAKNKRSEDKISRIDIFSHGIVEGGESKIAFGYHQYSEVEEGVTIEDKYEFDASDVAKIKSEAFESWGLCQSYACRTGAGNDGNGAVEPKKSLAQKIANQSGITVLALQNRSEYSNIIPDERNYAEMLGEWMGIVPQDQTYNQNGGTWDTDKAIDKINYPTEGSTPVLSPGWTRFERWSTPSVLK